jgi:hypothetical protein
MATSHQWSSIFQVHNREHNLFRQNTSVKIGIKIINYIQQHVLENYFIIHVFLFVTKNKVTYWSNRIPIFTINYHFTPGFNILA